ncbi:MULTISPECIES: hypothetical protein [Sphingobacterium]|uniref:hypothetical protein n=1 Tax=Sphingobacterium TaxID=28453 RepID=UPI0012FE54C8|nr:MULTISPECIES: hypothetical protein [Sphingobacterium]
MKHRRNTKEIADEAQANPKEDPNKEQRNTKERPSKKQRICAYDLPWELSIR